MKKILSLLLAVTIIATAFTALPFTVSAAEAESAEVGASSGTTGDCTWTLDDEGTLTISGNGYMDDYSYESILPWDTDIKKVVIEDGVTSIGYSAFYDCTNLESVTISDSVTSIGYSAFYGCKNLKSITIPDGVTSIDWDTFSSCTSLESIIIPDSVTSIRSNAFYGTAWYDNQPDGVVYAGKVAYKYKGTMPDNTSIVLKEGTKGIADEAFSGCTGLTSVTIPDSVTSIGMSAFSGCTSLTSVTIPDGVTSIDFYTFSSCTSLESIIIPDNVTSIAGCAFSGCTSLESVTIPDGVKSIGYKAFYGTSLASVTIPDSVTRIDERAFGYIDYYFDYESDEEHYVLAENFTIYGVIGTEAWRYANENGFIFIPIGEEVTPIGDSNGDGNVDVLDALAIQKYAACKADMTNYRQYYADVNGDNSVDILDATEIQKFAAGKITEFKKKG